MTRLENNPVPLFKGRIITSENGEVLYYSPHWNEFLDKNDFCSEEFYCNSCLERENTLRKGIVRYDSLVQCARHNEEAKIVLNKLRSVLSRNAVFVGDLGL